VRLNFINRDFILLMMPTPKAYVSQVLPSASAASWPFAHGSVAFADEVAVALDRRDAAGAKKKTLVRILIENLAQRSQHNLKKCLNGFHAVSSA
jgi:hypothetical protein